MAKPFAWSYSRYKAYDSCPKRFYEVSVAKNFVEESEQLRWGSEVHEALAAAVKDGTPLPDSMREYQHWVDEMRTGKFARAAEMPSWTRWLANPDAEIVVEEQYAITKDFQPTGWFDHNVWFRGICDVARFDPTMTVGLARDYKTGKIQHDSRQLMLMSQCLFIHIPSLKRLRTEFVWLQGDCITADSFDRGTIMREWAPLMPQVRVMEDAAKTLNYPPKPGGLCARFCPVLSCAYHGKRFRAA